MTENLKKFIAAARNDKQLAAQLEQLNKIEDRKEAAAKTMEIAGQHGFTLSDADFLEQDAQPLQDEELAAVAGGGCGCAIYGSGGGELSCTCYFGGSGHKSSDNSDTECVCAVGGGGWES